jgi:hypothetical protein
MNLELARAGVMTLSATTTEQSKPFFVLGAQRSGTTMLRLMLNNHPGIAVPHETAFITVFLPRLSEYGDLANARNVARLLDDIASYHLVVRGGHIKSKDAILSHAIRSYSDLVNAIMVENARAEAKSRWGDKTPFYTQDIDVLWNLFPGCQFIHLVRDGRDVAVSQTGISWLPNSVPQIAADWRHKTTICHKVGRTLPSGHFLEIRYEDLITRTEETLRTICSFLGEDYSPEMLSYHETAREVVPKESLKWHQASVSPPDPSKIGGWKRKLSRADRIIFEQIAGDALALFGYPREGLLTTFGSRIRNAVYFGIAR